MSVNVLVRIPYVGVLPCACVYVCLLDFPSEWAVIPHRRAYCVCFFSLTPDSQPRCDPTLLFDWPKPVNLEARKEDAGGKEQLPGAAHLNRQQLIKHPLNNTGFHTNIPECRLGWKSGKKFTFCVAHAATFRHTFWYILQKVSNTLNSPHKWGTQTCLLSKWALLIGKVLCVLWILVTHYSHAGEHPPLPSLCLLSVLVSKDTLMRQLILTVILIARSKLQKLPFSYTLFFSLRLSEPFFMFCLLISFTTDYSSHKSANTPFLLILDAVDYGSLQIEKQRIKVIND